MEWIYVSFTQLPYQTPILLAYLVGVILSLGRLTLRGGRFAAFSLAGCSLLLLTSVGFTFLRTYLVMSESSVGVPATFSLVAAGWFRLCGDAVGTGLLIAAVFMGRFSKSENSRPE
ncbi:MAG: hypothetical protein LBE59_03900 [Nevskiaceae bacterium]|jgi:hypothetical protein|nr:hypothetical protein [Nevskiaceae bacterium]